MARAYPQPAATSSFGSVQQFRMTQEKLLMFALSLIWSKTKAIYLLIHADIHPKQFLTVEQL
jgi:hypothetical protein